MEYLKIDDLEPVLKVYESLSPVLGEAGRRLFLAATARQSEYGAITYLANHTGVSKRTIERGIQELDSGDEQDIPIGYQRKLGGGRKSVLETYPDIMDCLKMILEDGTYGDPMRVLSWTNLSLDKIKDRLEEDYQIKASKPTISHLMVNMGYSLQQNQKFEQTGKESPDRNRQFMLINDLSAFFISNGEPVISCDTKKKEFLGNLKNPGQEYRPVNNPRTTNDHDWYDEKLGKIVPYGIYDIGLNEGFVSLGRSIDTADFATEGIARWWYTHGYRNYPKSKRLYILCDGGGSNSSRSRLWKYDLAELADRTGIEIWMSHFPPGTSKWNKVEHRLFCYISKSWAAKPLTSVGEAVDLIRSTTTKTGLRVDCIVDDNEYERGHKVSDEDLERIDIEYFGNDTHWNYIIKGFKDIT